MRRRLTTTPGPRPKVGQATTLNHQRAIILAVYDQEQAIDVRTADGREWRVSGLWWNTTPASTGAGD